MGKRHFAREQSANGGPPINAAGASSGAVAGDVAIPQRVERLGGAFVDSPLELPYVYSGFLSHIPATIMVSTATSSNFVNQNFVQRYNQAKSNADAVFTMDTFGALTPVDFALKQAHISIDAYADNLDFDVIPMHEELDVILGMPWCKSVGAVMHFGEQQSISIKLPNGEELQLVKNLTQ